MATITSYESPTTDGVVNQVVVDYNAFGQVITEYQGHGGAVDTTSTPKVSYAYSNGSANHSRLLSMTYPNGRVLHYGYNSGMDDALGRVSFLADPPLLPGEGWGEGIGQHLAEYRYLGLNSFVQVNYPQPSLRSDLAYGTGADPYTGMDQFGRIVDLRWWNTSTNADVERIGYGHDRASNRLWRTAPVATAAGVNLDELYSYDGVNQLVSLDRGQLDFAKTGLVSNSKTFGEARSLDMTGNWSRYQQDSDGDGTLDLDQSRTHNAVNEIRSFAATVGDSWATPAYDRAGNMTIVSSSPLPRAGEGQGVRALGCQYDAWNRLIRVTEDGTTIAEYQYDGRGFRILNRVPAQSNSTSDAFRHFYYSTNWQELEQRIDQSPIPNSQSLTLVSQHVWGLRYIDDLILRDSVANSTGELTERLYALQDANWNVTAIADAGGTIAERYRYSAYGQPAIFTAAFGVLSESCYGWEYLFTGRTYDSDTRLQDTRYRWCDPSLGRWMSEDPIGLAGGDVNLYRYVNGQPLTSADPFGLEVLIVNRFVYGGFIAHTFIRVTGSNGNVTTFSGTDNKGRLAVLKNDDKDYFHNYQRPPAKPSDWTVIPPPNGMTQDEWDKKVLESGDRAVEDAKPRHRTYAKSGGDDGKTSGNCHTISSEIIEKAGGVIPKDYDPPGANPGLRSGGPLPEPDPDILDFQYMQNSDGSYKDHD